MIRQTCPIQPGGARFHGDGKLVTARIRIRRSGVVHRELRYPGRNRLLLGKTLRRTGGGTVRLA